MCELHRLLGITGHARGGPRSGDAVDDSQASDDRDYDKCDYSTDYIM
jgi:hypothetical protein